MKYLQAGMKLRRQYRATDRHWWTNGKEYKIFESGHEHFGNEDFYIIDDDGDREYFNFDGESFTDNSEIILNFELVDEPLDDTMRVSMPAMDRFPHIRKDIRDLERAIQETKERLEYIRKIGHILEKDSYDLDWLKLSLLQQQWKSMNAILADLERIV